MRRMAKKPAAEEQAIAKPYEPKPEERATLEALVAQWKEKPPEQERLVPFVKDEVVISVDLNERQVNVDWEWD